METKHTPGPWKREAFGIWHTNEKGENRRVACAEIDRGEGPYKPSDEGEVVANARLIAAAPELLAALRFVQKYADMRAAKNDPLPKQLVESVQDAIALTVIT